MKTKPSMTIVVSAMMLIALTGNGKAIPISNDSIISFSKSSNYKDTNLEDVANFSNFGTIKGQKAGTVSGNYKKTAGAKKHLDAIARTKPLKSSKSRGKMNALQLVSPGVDPFSPSSWILSGFGTVAISGQGLGTQSTSGLGILTGQTPVAPSFTSSSPAIVPLPAAQTVQYVPDGGATALLLGVSLCGLGWLKRKSAA
jgi:hypothetical protein